MEKYESVCFHKVWDEFFVFGQVEGNYRFEILKSFSLSQAQEAEEFAREQAQVLGCKFGCTNSNWNFN